MVFCVLFIVHARPNTAVVAWENRPWSGGGSSLQAQAQGSLNIDKDRTVVDY